MLKCMPYLLLIGWLLVLYPGCRSHQVSHEVVITVDSREVADLVALSNHMTVHYELEDLADLEQGRRVFVIGAVDDGETKDRTKRSTEDLRRRLLMDPNVLDIDIQEILAREKRYPVEAPQLDREKRIILHNKAIELGITDEQYRAWEVERREYDRLQQRSEEEEGGHCGINFNDPQYNKQWYLCNVGQNGGHKGNDLNVAPCWKAGYTGKGVKVLVLDDGVDHTSTDITPNYDPSISADFNNRSSDGTFGADPHPDDTKAENSHGTRCAGEIAGVANNNFCGVGVAHEASIGGIRILDGPVTDSLEAKALTWKIQEVDIMSASWGPPDNGKTMEGPGKYCKRALRKAAEEGRGGKGILFAWASGNGGMRNDTCSADGYVGSIYTISIGSITEPGRNSYFMELCPSTMAVVFTGATHVIGEQTRAKTQVVTTDLHNGCIGSFQGTSAAAPLAAGIFALLLQANPDLTYRDVNHMIVQTAEIASNEKEGVYIKNGAGNRYHRNYGFGKLDCAAMLELALKWKADNYTAWPLLNETHEAVHKNVTIAPSDCVESQHEVPAGKIAKLEHVDLVIRIATKRRGDVRIFLASPHGTTSLMMEQRSDDAEEDLDFTFDTVMMWDEHPAGVWTVQVCNVDGERAATLRDWSLELYGTARRDDAAPARRGSNEDAGLAHVMTSNEIQQAMDKQMQAKQNRVMETAIRSEAQQLLALAEDSTVSDTQLQQAVRDLIEKAQAVEDEAAEEKALESADTEHMPKKELTDAHTRRNNVLGGGTTSSRRTQRIDTPLVSVTRRKNFQEEILKRNLSPVSVYKKGVSSYGYDDSPTNYITERELRELIQDVRALKRSL